MQGILGTSKNNPLFYTIYQDDDNSLDIYFGFCKLTNIPNDKNSILFKSTVAMLLNAGVCVKHLEENFNISFKTAKKYANAFNKSRDDNELLNNST